jgi:hypothetical protein
VTESKVEECGSPSAPTLPACPDDPHRRVNFHERRPELTQTSPIGGGSRERLGVSLMLDHLGGNVFTPKSTGIFFGAHAPDRQR